MSGMVIIVPVDELQPIRFHEQRRMPSLCRLQRIVGGYIEAVPLWEDYMGDACVVYCNEEGKLHGLPINGRATALWWQKLGQPVDDVLVGNVVLCIGFKDEDADDE